ncbi:PLP-dependent aminotransferase family protein [Alphaproteobacteria bacterium LSUCC0684]
MTVNEELDRVSILLHAVQTGPGLKYRKLAQKLAQLIKDGVYAEGEKLPTHRALSFDLGVTPGTVSKAYNELTETGFVIAKVGGGTFVSSIHDTPQAKAFKVYSDAEGDAINLSRNIAIPMDIGDIYKSTLRALGTNPETLEELQQYAPEFGIERHRQAGARWISFENFQALPEKIICTNGTQHALFCTLMATVKRGAVIATERFTYPGLISICRTLGIKMDGLEIDDEGLCPLALEAACQHKRISALYCTPTIQNPTTSVMSYERRLAIAQICKKYNVLIIEDETHASLEVNRLPSIGHFAPELGIVLSSMSKAVMTGLRVGYAYAPARLVRRISEMVRITCWMVTPSAFQIATHLINENITDDLINNQREEIKRRKSLVEPFLEGHHVKTHPYSPHFWIQMPDSWRASEICSELEVNGCRVASAESFAVDPIHTGQYIRASVSVINNDNDTLINGFQMLADTLNHPTSLPNIN